MKSTAQRKKQEVEQDGLQKGLRSVPLTEKKGRRSLLSALFSASALAREKQKVLVFHVDETAGLEEILELIRLASSLRGNHRRILVANEGMHPVFAASQLFSEILPLPANNAKSFSQMVRRYRADVLLSSGSATVRGIPTVQLKAVKQKHRFPSFWNALSLTGRSLANKNRRKEPLRSSVEKADLQLSRHNLRFRITMRRILDSVKPASHPIWIPVSLDPFTGSPWPFSSYMRLCRILAQEGLPFVVTFDEKGARDHSEKDRQVLQGLPVFRKELSLIERRFDGLQVLDAPSLDTQLSLARSATVVIGNPSAELLLSQIAGRQIIFLHDMLTFRSVAAGQAEELSAHASHGRLLFEDSLQMGGGLSMKPHVDECVRDCPACAHNYCVDTISPEAVWEQLRLFLAEKQ